MKRAGQGGRSDERAAGIERMAQQARGTHGALVACHDPWLVLHCEAAKCSAGKRLAPGYSCRVGCRHVGRERQEQPGVGWKVQAVLRCAPQCRHHASATATASSDYHPPPHQQGPPVRVLRHGNIHAAHKVVRACGSEGDRDVWQVNGPALGRAGQCSGWQCMVPLHWLLQPACLA